MKLKTLALTSLTLLALAACGKQAETSVPADSAQGNTSAPAAPAALTEGVNYTVLSNPIPQQQAGKIEVLEFFGYFCPHCAHLEPVLSEHTKTFKDDTYLRREHVIWGDEMKPLARLAAAVEMTGESDKANSHIFDAMVNQKNQSSRYRYPEKNGCPSKLHLTAKKYWLHLRLLKAKRVRLKWKS